MNNKKGSLLWLLSLLFLIAFEGSSWSAFQLTPRLMVREEYNDNIYLTSSDEKGDFITTINPAFNLKFDSKIMTLSLDYGLNFRMYAHNSKENETGLSQTQRAKLETTLNAYKDVFFIKVSDEYSRVPIDERRQVAMDNLLANMTDSNKLIINPYLEYALSNTLKVQASYAYENIWYRAEEGNDAINHRTSVGLVKEITPKIVGTLSYTYLIHRPKKTPEYNSQNILLSLAYQISKQISVSGGVGHSWFNYKEGNNMDDSIWNINGKYSVSETLSFSAGYSESFLDSVSAGTYKSKAINATVEYNAKLPVKITVFDKKDVYNKIDREDKSKGIILDIGVPVTSRITGNLRGNYTKYDFNSPDENADRYGFGLSLDYKLKNAVLGIGYTYNLNNSDIDLKEYRNNIVWLQYRHQF